MKKTYEMPELKAALFAAENIATNGSTTDAYNALMNETNKVANGNITIVDYEIVF